MTKFNPLFWFIILANLLVAGLFIIPSFVIYQQFNQAGLRLILLGAILSGAVIYFWSKIPIGRRFGRGLAVNGLSFWGLGWAIMVLFEPRLGWLIFVAGWLSLAVGLFIIGTADFHKKQSVRWTVLPLIAGILPPLMELFHPYHFSIHFDPLFQLQLMFLFAIGWLLQGGLVNQNKLPEMERMLEPKFSSSN